MKKNFCFLLTLMLALTGCSLINGTSKDNGSSSSSGELSEPSEQSESTSSSLSETDDGLENYPMMDGDILRLNPYGDYVAGNDENLLSTYVKLTKKVTSDANGVYQSSYEKGLLEFFNYENKVDIKLNVTDELLNQLNNDHEVNNKETFRICSVDISFIGLTFHYEEVGIRQKGNLSRGPILSGDLINLRHYKLSFEETFDDEYVPVQKQWTSKTAYEYRQERDFFGLSKIDLRWNRNFDTTYLREYYAFEMYRANGALSARSNPVHVSMNNNGKENNLGIYLAVETITKSFIKRNFVKNARGGNLYKLSWGSGDGARFNPVNNNFFGVETQTKNGNAFSQTTYTYDLKTNKEENDHTIIKNFISILSNQHGNTAYEFANQYLDYQQFLTYISISYLLGDPDDLRGNYNNSYIYFIGETNKMVIIPTDNDRVLGAAGDGGNPTGHHGALNKPFDKNTGYGGDNNSNLFNKLLFSTNSTTIRPDYINRIQEIIDNGWMNPTKYENIYNVIENNYKSLTELGSSINYFEIAFSFDEQEDVYSNENLSVSTYLTTKTETYLNNKGN